MRQSGPQVLCEETITTNIIKRVFHLMFFFFFILLELKASAWFPTSLVNVFFCIHAPLIMWCLLQHTTSEQQCFSYITAHLTISTHHHVCGENRQMLLLRVIPMHYLNGDFKSLIASWVWCSGPWCSLELISLRCFKTTHARKEFKCGTNFDFIQRSMTVTWDVTFTVHELLQTGKICFNYCQKYAFFI